MKKYSIGFILIEIEPNLDPEALKALQIQSDFLLDHGYLAEPVNVSEWVDDSFLTRALSELELEERKIRSVS